MSDLEAFVAGRRSGEEEVFVGAAPSPALTRDLVDITGIDAIERSLRADLRAAVEALEGRCHDGEGLGCEAHPCVENVGRDEVLALLADPVVVGVVVNEAGL